MTDDVTNFINSISTDILFAPDEAWARDRIQKLGAALRAAADDMDARLKHRTYDVGGRQPLFVVRSKF